MKLNKTYLLGVVMLVLFAGFAFTSFNQALTPYVPFEQARQATRMVQVAGGLQAGSASYDEVAEALLFTLVEEETGETLRVRYHGVKPANFEEAISIVAIGRYEMAAAGAADGVMAADKLLVKCPSKYQGAEVDGEGYQSYESGDEHEASSYGSSDAGYGSSDAGYGSSDAPSSSADAGYGD